MASPAVTRPTLTRDQQLAQLHRRYGSGPTIALKPSDPDFVYPLPSLQFHLHVPDAYPSERPSIRVLNGELPAWAKKNVEQGFKAIAERGRERWEKTTLLDLLRVLDRELEDLLSAGGEDEPRMESQLTSTRGSRSATPIDRVGNGDSIKIVRPAQGRVAAIRTPASPAVVRTPPLSAEPSTARSPTPPTSAPVRAPTPKRAYTPSELSGAASKRAQDIRQLISRLKLSPLFSGSPEGTHFTVPIESPKKYLLPVPLQPLNSARLIVPKSYNLEPPRIEILGTPGDLAKRIEERFAEHVTRNSELSLTAAVNVLAAKLHLWAVAEELIAPKIEKISTPKEGEETAQQSVDKPQEHSQEIDPGKAHIKVIPRPPEWGLPNDDDDDDDDSSGSDLDSTDQDEDGHHNHTTGNVSSSGPPDGDHHSTISERGTSLSCPGIQLAGIDLLTVSSLNLTIKCLKCRTEQDILNLRGTQPNERAMPRAVRCQKCSDVLGIGFRKEFVHQGSQRLGFFDLMNCSIAELRPMDLIPQCEECSSEEIRQELRGVMRGQMVFTNCRTCFKRMSVCPRIPRTRKPM